MVVGEQVTLEEMGGARMHAEVSGCGDQLAADDAEAIEQAKQYFGYLPQNWRSAAADASTARSRRGDFTADLVPAAESAGYDIHTVIDALVDEGSFFEVKPLFAPELVTGFGLLDGEVVGIVANQPAVKGGVLFVDSADKGARFIWQCDAFNVPLLYLADVPGFMIGSAVERQGIIRHGAKMITAVAEATVPTVSVIVRKAYGAGPVRDGRARVRAGRLPGAADGQDRGDGSRRRRSTRCTRTRSPRSPTRPSGRRTWSGCARRTRPTSTSCGWPASWWSTPSSSPATCAGS